MGANRKQLMRMVKFIAEVRRNTYPNSRSFAEKLTRSDWLNEEFKCTSRTVQRDISILIEEYKAPLKFDPAANGYYLADRNWEFQTPLLCEEHITHFLLSARLTERLVPEPLSGAIRNSIDSTLAVNTSEFLDQAFLDSLLMASGQKTQVDSEIFRNVFTAWRNQVVLEFDYRKPDSSISSRRFEPHIIAFHKGLWYIKGYLTNPREVRVFALHRIQMVRLVDGMLFRIDRELLQQTVKEGLFGFSRLSGIRLRCDASIAFYLREHQPVKRFKLEPQANGDLIVTLAPAIEHEVIRWILGEAGRIEVLEPVSLRQKIATAGKAIWQNNFCDEM